MYFSKKQIIIFGTILVVLFAVVFFFKPTNEMTMGSFDDHENIDVSPSEFITFINSNIVVENDEANVLIENSTKNHDSCIVRIYEKANDTPLYESDIIPVGYCIEKAKLQTSLSKGEHEGYAVFEVLNDNLEIKSTMTIDVKITVK